MVLISHINKKLRASRGLAPKSQLSSGSFIEPKQMIWKTNKWPNWNINFARDFSDVIFEKRPENPRNLLFERPLVYMAAHSYF